MKGESGPWCGEAPAWIHEQLPGGPLGSSAEDIARVANELTSRIVRGYFDGSVNMNPAVRHGLGVLVQIHSDPRRVADYDRLVFQVNTNLNDAVAETAEGTK